MHILRATWTAFKTFLAGATLLILMTVPLAAWLTHLAICFRAERWGFLIAGAIFFPIAIVHGIGIWFGWW